MTGARLDPDVRDALESLLARGWGPTAALRRVEEDRQFRGRTPSLRTVTSMKRRVAPADDSGVWSPALAPLDEAVLVFPVLRDLVAGGHLVSLTVAMARWVARVRLLAPDLEVIDVMRFAGRYLAGERAGSVADVDTDLARFVAGMKRPPGPESEGSERRG